jgi:hypothetical protein
MKISGLLDDFGLKLLTASTGIDAAAKFEEARRAILDAFAKWNALPQTVSKTLWNILNKIDDDGTTEFKQVVTDLADPAKAAQALVDVISKAAFGSTPIGTWLETLSSQGTLALLNEMPFLQTIARQTLEALNGGVIQQLQKFINANLDLTKIEDAIKSNDFTKVNAWLQSRLSAFLDKEINDIPGLKEVQAAINQVVTLAPTIHEKAIQAVNNTYTLQFAATYQRNTTDKALLDVDFDLSKAAALALFKSVMDGSGLRDLLVGTVAGVTINEASLSHEIKQSTCVELHMPFVDVKKMTVTDSLASLTVEHDSGRLLVYQLGATNIASSANRYNSQLSVLCKLGVKEGKLDFSSLADASVAYQLLQVKPDMTLSELQAQAEGFLTTMKILKPQEVDRFFIGLDQTVSHRIATSRNDDFGDVTSSMQVVLPASVLENWLDGRGDAQTRAAGMNLSRALQGKLKSVIPFCFFQDLSKLNPADDAVCALLVWSSMTVSTSLKVEDGVIKQFNTDDDFFWNFPDRRTVEIMANDSRTIRNLAAKMPAFHHRLASSGREGTAGFFDAAHVESFVTSALSDRGFAFLDGLLATDSDVIGSAVAALMDGRNATANLSTAPQKAIASLARFGADIVETFHKNLGVFASDEYVRTLCSLLLAEGSAALKQGPPAMPAALFQMNVLQAGHSFNLTDYLTGALPPKEQIVVGQALTNLGASAASAALPLSATAG